MFRFFVCACTLAILGVNGQAGYGYQPYADDASIYSYDWRVQDSYTGQDFGQGEVRQGFTTDGEYQVVLPDGRKQIVTYKVADQNSGYVADVRYEGQASYEAPVPYRAPYAAPAPYSAPVAPYAANIVTPAPYVAPAPVVTAAPYVAPAPVVTPAPYVAPVQPYAYAPAPYRPYAPVQPYQVPTTVRQYNFQPVAEAVEPLAPVVAPVEAPVVAPVEAPVQAPAAPVEPIAPVADLGGEALTEKLFGRNNPEGIEVENPVPVVEKIENEGEWASIFYEDAHGLKPQRKEKVHVPYY